MTKLALALITLLLVVSCDATPTPIRDELGKLVDTQTQATIAAAQLSGAQRVAAL